MPNAVTTISCILLFAILTSTPAFAQHDPSHHSAYADFADRDVKALSGEQIEQLLAGEGMGMALPAELNGYPGPKHVLELAEPLELTAEQRAETQKLFHAMKEEATSLGQEIVEAEKTLDDEFSSHQITAEKLDSLTAHIAALQGRLRAAHLHAHLAQVEILTHPQRHKYNTLRGYATHGDKHE
ncbi:MAG: periplasmic heavy metal sensor [Rhodothermia bacterium]|nr:periplasmic heavy metal sensor [Rhodothermia bacterium]